MGNVAKDADKAPGDANYWNDEVDVIVVGFGGAGACAAIEAADRGSSVLVVERFSGGGSTMRSGGVIYAGGGTPHQEGAGFNDTPENMFNYLEIEVQDVVSKETLRSFCERSCDNLSWLEAQGVRFGSTLCPTKTSYPPDHCYLYYSGNETVPAYSRHAVPVPRGHRAMGRGLTGNVLFKPLGESARRKGAKVLYRSKDKRYVITIPENKILDRPFLDRLMFIEFFSVTKCSRQR